MRTLSRFVPLSLVVCLAAACSQSPESSHTSFSMFMPTDLNQIADASSLRVQGVVRSEPEIHEVPPDPAPPGADGSSAPSMFSYEVVQLEIERVLGRPRTDVQAGDVISIGVAIVTASEDVTVEQSGDEGIVPGSTFADGAGSRGLFFLTDLRPLGTSGEGYEVMGFAEFEAANSERGTIKGVSGPLQGRSVARDQTEQAATRPPRE